MPYFLKGNCVHKGTKEDPGEQVKCHEDHAKAVAHMKALYVNADEDAEKLFVDVGGEWYEFVRDKGGPGSGWHGPAEGTHTAANAPNFAGGPGADRKYGAEDEPKEGQKHCKCTKCDSIFTLPKGKQCKDVECPGCGGRATQTSPRKDKPAEGEEGGGQGGKKSQATHECVCPECARSVHVPVGQKSSEVPCPDCGVMMTEKAVHGEGSMLGEVSSVMDEGDSVCKCPNCKKELPCTAKACPHCKQSIDRVDRGEGEKDAFTSYKAADGTWRWATLSNWAVVDKEREVVSEQAYRDAIAYAQKTGNWGELDLVHVNGTDVGDCDMLFIQRCADGTAKIGGSGAWYDTAKATNAREVIQAEPEDWGVSIKFRFNPGRRVRGVYTGDIQVLKHSILPRQMAASYGTAIAVQGGEKMSKVLDEKTAEALRNLKVPESEIEELAEKSKAQPPEENVVEKQEETTTPEPDERSTIWATLGKALGINPKEDAPAAPVPEARKADEVIPAEKTEKTGDETPAEEAVEKAEQPVDAGAMAQALGEVIAKQVGTMVKEQQDENNKRIGALEAQLQALSTSIEEKVEQRLRDMAPAAKVAPVQVSAMAVDEKPKGLTFGHASEEASKWTQELVADIVRVAEEKTKGAGFTI